MTLALIAGQGALPALLVAALRTSGEMPLICEMRGFAPDLPDDLPRLTFRLETFGTFLHTLSEAGVTRVCMAGAVRRPTLEAEAIDARTAPLVPKVMAALAKGDDGALRVFIDLFEAQGLTVVAAHEIAPDLLPPASVLTDAQPPDIQSDHEVARAALAQMGAADLGQAVVVRDGAVIAREDDRGTDAMLGDLGAVQQPPATGLATGPATGSDGLFGAVDAVGDMLGDVADWLSGTDGDQAPPEGHGILFKAPKPDQDRRADLPTIGAQTARNAVACGLSGIVIEAGGVLVLDLPQVIEILNDNGLFLLVAE